jgi:hypothetical protein
MIHKQKCKNPTQPYTLHPTQAPLQPTLLLLPVLSRLGTSRGFRHRHSLPLTFPTSVAAEEYSAAKIHIF